MDKYTKQIGLKFLLFAIASLLFGYSNMFAQNVELSYYLPQDITYNQNISTPSEVIGHEVGEFHITHDKLVYYMHHLANQSDRITIQQYGKTHEKRPLVMLTITSPENHSKIEELKNQHKKLSTGERINEKELTDIPLVTWLGYSVHGNESSGSNSALLVAYYLAAAENPIIDELLSNTVILLDPSINPDGLQRFSTWVNSNKSKNLIADVNSMEHNEPWPSGRTNHYWFDLNRDWLLIQQPESKGRIALFHEWKPNVLTDHHEMGSNSTLFFQPGVPSRKHPLTPDENVTLTQAIADYHAVALDNEKQLYFTKENFDDFYYGKGSTYPDLHGSIGILFEQASSRGHVRETDNGILRFPQTIKNQLTVTLSTLKGSLEMKDELLSYQSKFYRDAIELGENEANNVIIIGSQNDKYRLNKLAEILLQHKIDLYIPHKDINIGNKSFNENSSYLIPLNQRQHLLVKALFEKRKTFKDSLFYDISAWSLDLSFNIEYAEFSDKSVPRLIQNSEKLASIDSIDMKLPEKSNYAYIFNWDQYQAPAFLNKLLQAGVKVKVATEEFRMNNSLDFSFGSILIPLGNQTLDQEKVFEIITRYSKKYKVDVVSLPSGATSTGIDLGSPKFLAIEKPKILMLVGEKVNAYEAGEIWHLLDNKMDIPVTLVPMKNLSKIDLYAYNTILMADGSYNELDDLNNIKDWVNEGGTIIAMNDAVKWLKNKNVIGVNLKFQEKVELENIAYNQREKFKGAQNMGGAIFNTKIDVTHPLCYGYQSDHLPVFKDSKLWLEASTSLTFNNPIIFTSNPLISGYISDKNLNNLSESAGVMVVPNGKGKVIAFSFNPNFRAFWYGTEKVFFNSIFFSQIIQTTL